MTNLNIDRLTLKLSGLSELEGQRLARLVTEGLASSDIFSNLISDRPILQITIPSRLNASENFIKLLIQPSKLS